jgi:hypothetical protein
LCRSYMMEYQDQVKTEAMLKRIARVAVARKQGRVYV